MPSKFSGIVPWLNVANVFAFKLVRQMLHTTVDDTLEVETNLLKALVRTTALAIDPTAQHQEVMAVVELVKITHQAIRLQLR